MFTLSLNTIVKNQHPEDKVLINAAKILTRDLQGQLTGQGDANVIRLEKGSFADLNQEEYQIVTDGADLVIQANTSLGVMYGALAISREALGIDDTWYFLDVATAKKETATFDPASLKLSNYHVKYRGWFVNDEVMISRWADHDSTEYVWERIYETLLRMGGNVIIAGTDKNSHANRKPANAYGLTVTHHHAEPLGSEMFARIYPDLEASYLKYPELFEAIWQESVDEQAGSNLIWSLGFRGQGDRPFWVDDKSREWTEEAKAEIINSVIQLQYDMVKKADPNAVCAVNIYGELAQMFHEDLLDLPEDVLEIWADNGYGKMVSRRQESDDPRTEVLSEENKLGNDRGVYYHVAFHDLQASNFLTKLPNSPAFVSAEMEKVRSVGMDTLVVTNTGNIKPHILFLREVALSWLTDYQERNNEEIFTDYLRFYPNTKQGAAIKEAYIRLFEAFIQYGPQEDQKAGDEFYTYTIRRVVQSLLRRDEKLEAMEWLTGESLIDDQVQKIADLIQPKIAEWESLLNDVQRLYLTLAAEEPDNATRLYNDLILDVNVHAHGIKALAETIKTFQEAKEGNQLHAFLHAYAAKEAIDAVLKSRQDNPSDKWRDFYDNDVFTNMGMTKRFLTSLMQYIRLLGDNHEQYGWEREYLMEKGDAKVMLLSNVHDALSDDYLASKLQYLIK